MSEHTATMAGSNQSRLHHGQIIRKDVGSKKRYRQGGVQIPKAISFHILHIH